MLLAADVTADGTAGEQLLLESLVGKCEDWSSFFIFFFLLLLLGEVNLMEGFRSIEKASSLSAAE